MLDRIRDGGPADRREGRARPLLVAAEPLSNSDWKEKNVTSQRGGRLVDVYPAVSRSPKWPSNS